MAFKIKLEPKAFEDIQEAIEYYNEQQVGLGKRFHKTIKLAFDTLKNDPFFQIKYDEVRCFYTKPFPFLIHYIVIEHSKTVLVLAIIHTSRNPNTWPKTN
jgi:plasmid stabilization system protein ParE